MEVNLSLTPHECEIVLLLSESTISGGHWGDGDAIFSDEAHALEKLHKNKKGVPVSYTARDAGIMALWIQNHCESKTDGRLTLNAEHDQLLKKMQSAMNPG
jgi:hypothetical protein